ncbi:MAG: hypothetical protein CME21_02680 [Gemmatimonadetes bacterium]|nr:hypothetical protein [Gemmatimonadota bacterium]
MRRATGLIGPTLWLHALACFVWAGVVVCEDRVNVLLITVDTFRPDRLSGYGHDRQTSPYLDSLAADGALFEQALSSSSWTTPGLLSVLSGQYAPTHGVDVRGKSLEPRTPTFATELSRAGYVTPDILYLSSIPNLQNIGLTNTYVDRDKYLPEGDQVLFQALEAYQDSAFFLYYHYRNLHLPYNPSEPYDRLYTPKDFDRDGFVRDRVEVIRGNVTIPLASVSFTAADTAWMRGLYDGQIREMDENFFRPLVKKLKALELYERTLVIVTADHGEELLEHGFVGHPSTSFIASAYDEQLLIPLVMTCPKLILGNTRVQLQVQNVDILPTALDLLGLPIPETIQGRSLKTILEGGSLEQVPAFTETTQGGYQSTPQMMYVRARAHRDPPWKLIETQSPGNERYELYNLTDDPGEMRDLSHDYPDIVNRMRRELHVWLLSASRKPEKTVKEKGIIHSGSIDVLYPANGDTLRYVDAEKTVDVRWTGTVDASYAIEYRVGQGNYYLEGQIPVVGLVSTHGPFTEEMWNMLTLYNPFRFRVVGKGSTYATAWVSFEIAPTTGGSGPGVSARVLAGSVFVRGEAALLLSGLLAGLGIIVSHVASTAASDILGWALLFLLSGALVAPVIVGRLGRARVRAWGLVVVYTGLIYATLSVAPVLWGEAFRLTHGRIDYAAAIVGVAVVVWILISLMRRRIGWIPFLGVLGLGTVYVWLLMWLSQSPAERFHLAEYGLLSYLIFRACRIDFDYGKSIAIGLLVASLLGAGDETIQWALPNRVFEWKDIWLNVGSSVLGMCLVVLLAPEDRRGEA